MNDAELRRLAEAGSQAMGYLGAPGMKVVSEGVLALLDRIEAVRTLLDDEHRHLAMSRATYNRLIRAMDGDS